MHTTKLNQQQGYLPRSDGTRNGIEHDRLDPSTFSPGNILRRTGIGSVLLLSCHYGSLASAAEIANFRTIDVEGEVELRYLHGERTDSNAGIESFRQRQNTYEEEISVQTRNYVFHPNFLKLDLGAGFTFVQDSFETDIGSNSNDDGLYSLHGRARLLDKKPYPMTFFYTRDNPVSFPGLAERVQQTNTIYGFNLSLLEPLVPLRLNLFASHNDFSGDGSTQVVDDSIDKLGLRASKVYSENYSHQLDYDHTRERSASGRLDLPIDPTLRITEVLIYTSDWRIRSGHQIRYYDRASLTRQEGPVDRDEFNFTPNLLWTHSDKTQTSYSYNFLDSSVDDIDTTNQTANALLHYNYDEQTEYELRATLEDNTTTGVDNRSNGVKGLIAHSRPVTLGTLSLNAGLGYRQNDREATSDQASRIGELVTLVGFTPVALVNEFVIASSIDVQNLARSQTFVEGIDYRVIVVGSQTEIQRLSGSSIGDPEQVVVDYAYQTGGVASYTNLEQSYSAMLSSDKNYNVYLRYRITDQDLSSGNPTLPLNSKNTLSYGGGIEFPLNDNTEIGTSIDLVEHDEDISPYDSQRYSVFSQFFLSQSSTLRIAADRSVVDNLNSVEDVDLTAYSLILRARSRDRLTLTAELYTEEDTGGTILRKRDSFRLLARWQIYRLTMNASADFSNDQTGDAETERADFRLSLTRDF